MGYLAQATIDDILSDPSRNEHYYNVVRPTFLSNLGAAYAGVPDKLLRLMWCVMVAHHLKPYGNSGKHALADLLAEPHLDCDNYNSLAIRLYQLMSVNNDVSFALLGWNGGAVGNHAQITAWSGAWSILMDPTVCVYAKTGYNDLVMGKPATGLMDFYWQWNNPPINTYKNTVRNALSGGQYRPIDCLYYFHSIEHYLATGGSANWGTPQAATIV